MRAPDLPHDSARDLPHDSARDLPHDSARDPHDSARGFPGDPGCDDLRPDLFLYAEGELTCPSSLLGIRRHLRGCPSCRERLAGHDVLTRAILAGGGGEDLAHGFSPRTCLVAEDPRADRIMDLIRRLPTPSGAARPPRLVGYPHDSARVFPHDSARVPSRTTAWRPARIAAFAAAALCVVGLLASLAAFTSIRPRAFQHRLRGPGESALAAVAPETTTQPRTDEERILWLALPRDRALEVLPPDSRVRLLGFRPDLDRAPDEGDALECMVEAIIDARPPRGKRVFLVPEGSDVTAIEIAPRAWLERRRVLLHSPDVARFLRAPPVAGERAYRAYVVDDPGLLGGAAPEPLLGTGRLLLPGDVHVHGAAPREWVLPARWRN